MLDHYKIGNQISLLRREKGLTGEQFAEKLGVSPQAISKWENGKCLPETSLLPKISEILGISIDSLLTPKELIILSAIYTDGQTKYDLTNTVNNYIHSNRLNITVNSRYLGVEIKSNRLCVLTVKYKTTKGTFYDFAVQNSDLILDADNEILHENPDFEIVGAYYGNKQEYQSAMTKMKHYDYYHWNEINVNHESFPSSPGVDEAEFLTLIYINKNGIHVISCEENEILTYSIDRTDIFLKDTSTCILPGIVTLEWENGMDCTWAGAMYAALNYMGEPYTYEQIMGMSGACYRIAFTDVWDWSATDALVAFDYSSILFHAIGYEQIWADRIDKNDRSGERKNIITDLNNNKPVLAINLRIAPEWGVITGYSDSGKILYCRTYFDKEYLNENKDYLESDFWPFLILHFGNKVERPSDTLILKSSLGALINSFEAKCERGYYQGEQAYEKWIDGLRNETLWNDSCPKEDIDRRLGVNDSLLLNLIDARRCAAEYLIQCASFTELDNTVLLKEMSAMFASITQQLHEFRTMLKASEGELLRYNVIDTKSNVSLRIQQAVMLEEILIIERRIVDKAKEILGTLA